jgi:endonuclease YncB( thermonuclease family)
MKILQYILWLLLIPAPLIAWEGKVVEVIDGDSIVVLQENRRVHVQLAAIDCPEMNQPWGEKARQLTAYLTFGNQVIVWPAYEDSDGQYFAFVFTEDINLNKALLRAGLAWHYRKYSRDPLLTALEMEARAAKKGLWSDPKPVAPWEFREQRSDI